MGINFETLRSNVRLHGKVARVAIVATRGSAPRETGTEMLVWEGGQLGTIGGGALEFQAIQEAFKGDYLKTIPLGPDLGQCCGGSVTLVNEIFDTSRLNNAIIEKCFSRRVIGSHKKPPAIIKYEKKMKISEYKTDNTITSKGWVSEKTEIDTQHLWVYGAGHVGRAIVNTLSPLPTFELTWLDIDKERFPKDIPSSVKIIYSENLAQLSKYAPEDCNHIIVTYSHALDLDLCDKILSYPFRSLGLIGSETKWAKFKKRLTELGHKNDRISEITCPIGSPELGKHPQVIAISLAQKLLALHQETILDKEGSR